MSRSLRYCNPIICQHLASQYVAGIMSKRVQRRTEVLRLNTPELDRAIAQWSDQFSTLYDRLNDIELPEKTQDKLWQSIEREIDADTVLNSKPFSAWSQWWNNTVFWRVFSGIGTMASVMLAIFLVYDNPQHSTQSSGPNYLANMIIQNDADKKIQFVISAYAKKENQASRLHIQWLKDRTEKMPRPLHLWAEERGTGKLVYIGIQPDGEESWDLTKSSWTAITSSHRLLMTQDSQQPSDRNIVFSGLCLQLAEWKS